MFSERSIDLIPYFVSLAITLVLAVYALPRLRAHGAIAFLTLTIAESSWIIGYIGELLAADIEGKLLWDSIQYFGLFAAGAGIFMMASDFAGNRRGRSLPVWLLIWLTVLALSALLIGQRQSPLFYLNPTLLPAPPYGTLNYNFGPGAYILILATLALIIAGLIRLGLRARRQSGVFRNQTLMMLLGILLPVLLALPALFNISLLPQRDSAPIWFGLGNIFLALGIFRFRTLDLVPIARERLFENMGDGAIVLDEELRLIDCNAAARGMLQISGTHIGLPILAFPAPWPELLSASDLRTEVRICDNDRSRWFELLRSPLGNTSQQRSGGALFIVRDITERHNMEEALRSARDELEQRVCDRTAELQATNALLSNEIVERVAAQNEQERLSNQLIQSQKMESIGRLAGGIAHDFNNLLTGIMGYAEMARGIVPGESPAGGMMVEIGKIAERAAGLTRQLLTFSRKQIIEPVPADLNTLIADMHKMLVRIIGEDVILDFLPGRDLPAVKIDKGQMEQVLVNLSVNARDAMPGGGRLTLETAAVTLDAGYCEQHPEAKPGPQVMLAVSDTGTGIPPHIQSRIFEPFFTTKGVGKGTGLGLSMVWGAVKQHGGSLEVYSETGSGTVFKIYLPVCDEQISTVVEQTVKTTVGGNETILLVEDDPVVRSVAERILSGRGYTIIPCTGPEEALDFAEAYRGNIDLLLSDVVMPVMNGRALSEKILVLRPGIRILFSSGYTENVIVHQGVLEQDIDFIGKPYNSRALLEKVRTILDRKPRPSAS